MNFSVLMSIYHKEKPEYFDRCMQSIWNEQSVKPNEIVLVEDGKLTPELYEVIDKWEQKLDGVLIRVPLEKNVGLGEALNIGLQKCTFEIVARMDTDDIARSDRFEKQMAFMNNNSDIDVISSWVSEFETDEKSIISYRKVPQMHDEIKQYAKQRNPLNHPSVMYQKSKVLKVGGYKHMLWFEDYYLWARMMINGAKFYNIQETLVNMRAGYGQLQRRSGLNYAIAEYRFQKELLNLGFIGFFEFVRNISVRLIARVAPKSVVKLIYKSIRS